MPFAVWPPVVRSVRKSRRLGFTLLELMIVVAIIGITAALAAPGIVRAMAISRADRANHDVVRVLRYARSQAMAFGRSFLVHYDGAAGGRIELWQGTTSACRLEDWAAIRAGSCDSSAPPAGNCVDYVDAPMYASGYHSIAITTVGNVDVCFQPNGDALVRGSGSVGPFAAPVSGAVQIEIDRLEGGATSGDPIRAAVVPMSGAPRVRR